MLEESGILKFFMFYFSYRGEVKAQLPNLEILDGVRLTLV